MGRVDVPWIVTNYVKALAAIKLAVEGGVQALKTFISSCLMGMDGGLIGELIGWAVGKVIQAVMDLETKALAIVLRLEYVKRAGKTSYDNAMKAYNLSNKCSRCKCIGHNKQNHDDALDKFLMANRLVQAAEDVQELVEIADEDDTEDSWFGMW